MLFGDAKDFVGSIVREIAGGHTNSNSTDERTSRTKARRAVALATHSEYLSGPCGAFQAFQMPMPVAVPATIPVAKRK